MEINGEQVNGTKTYAELGLSEAIMRAIEKKGYVQATPVQAGAIPYFMEWKDVIAKAPTGTGKTFATANLAAVLALGGKRVLAIDGDMRKGSLSGFVGNPNKGLAGYLAGTYADAAELVCPYAKCPGLDIMPVGTLPDNPTELLSSGRLEPFVDEMRRRYDYVLIDCPPVNVVADTAIIARNVDNTVFVLRAGMTDRSVLPDVEKLYLSARLRNMTLVINDVACTEEAFGTDTGYVYAGRHL